MPTLTHARALEGVVRPLDTARRALLRKAWRVPGLGNAIRSVDARVPFLATASVTLSLVLSCFVPGVLFVLGPVLFGVPHIASDVRYLVLRRRQSAYWTLAVAAGCSLLIALRIAESFGSRFPFALAEVSLGWTWVGLGVWMGACATGSRPNWRRASLVTLPIGAVAAFAVAHPGPARAVLAYGHNLVAPLIWLVLFRGRGRKSRAVLPLVLVGAGAGLLLSGITIPWLHFDDPWITRLVVEARSAAPGLAPATALGIGLSYVFLQAVHYSIWLVWIPREEIRGTMLTFRMSARAARRDFGATGIALVIGATLVMATASVLSVHRTRHLYLSVATFHAYLELACLAFLWMQRPRETPVVAAGADRPAP